jgi:hypothetical protein
VGQTPLGGTSDIFRQEISPRCGEPMTDFEDRDDIMVVRIDRIHISEHLVLVA